jgi:hypothetical protein
MNENELPPPQPLFDLGGMGPDDAKDYVLSLTAHLKQTEAALKTAEEEFKLWEERLVLASQRGQADLIRRAEDQKADAAARKTQLELEVRDFRAGVDKVKKQLLLLPLTQRTVNTDVLQENLAHLGGSLDSVTPTVKKIQADEALAALKKRMSGGS